MDFFPFFRRPYYYSDPFQNRYMQNQYQIRRNRAEKKNKKNEAQINNIETNKDNVESRNDQNSQKILGFNSDDVLIIVLLLFLYNEGVRDKVLFAVLIMLLLT